jgi:ribosomal protein L13
LPTQLAEYLSTIDRDSKLIVTIKFYGNKKQNNRLLKEHVKTYIYAEMIQPQRPNKLIEHLIKYSFPYNKENPGK